MNTKDLLSALNWPSALQDQNGALAWSTPASSPKGYRALAIKTEEVVHLRVDPWGLDGAPTNPLEALFNRNADGGFSLQRAHVGGVPVTDAGKALSAFKEFTDKAGTPQFEPAPKPRARPGA